jgi:prefoldin subunit 5
MSDLEPTREELLEQIEALRTEVQRLRTEIRLIRRDQHETPPHYL